ncbi:MAG: DUF3800 domain-containing protein [Bacillota bacterium]|nr:DUF3800 domain-containing protein [Bacillota bacterium]
MFLTLGAIRDLRVVNICVRKEQIAEPSVDVLETAWRYLLQRYETFLEKRDGLGMILPDDGQASVVRSLTRKMRVYNPIPSKYRPGEYYQRLLLRVLEDPFNKKSEESLFVQAADMIAYSLALRDFPRPPFDQSLFERLSPILLREASGTNDLGIVYWPQEKPKTTV